jgi:hypothetical protein
MWPSNRPPLLVSVVLVRTCPEPLVDVGSTLSGCQQMPEKTPRQTWKVC